MPITLREVLDDPSLADGDPVVLAGHTKLAGLVRWVHTSEVFEIADLLRGGELLLIGGVALAGATKAERAQYIRALSERGVAGLAIEIGPRLPTVPPAMIADAERLGLPLIALRRVVPFVAVTEAINGLLINESVRRLQLADRVSRALAAALAAGEGLDKLLKVLADEVDADAELISLSGELIARSDGDGEHSWTGAVMAPITCDGATLATLALHPRPSSNPLMVAAAQDRAPEVLGIALARSRPLSPLERYAREFLSLVRSGSCTSRQFRQLADRLAIAEQGPWVSVLVRLDDHRLYTTAIEAALRRTSRTVISTVHRESYLAVVALRGAPLRLGRTHIVQGLRAAQLPLGLQVVVGPGTRSLAGLGRCVREADNCFELVEDRGADVVDAADLCIERLVHALDRSEIIADFVDEHIGELREQDARGHGTGVQTLACYLRHLGSKTDTAEELHIQRQTLYQRLDKIFTVIGPADPGTAKLNLLAMAVEFDAAHRPEGQQLRRDR